MTRRTRASLLRPLVAALALGQLTQCSSMVGGVDAGPAADAHRADVPVSDVSMLDVPEADTGGPRDRCSVGVAGDIVGAERLVPNPTTGAPGTFCALGDPVAVDVAPGFCVRRYASIRGVRTLVVASDNTVLVAAPLSPTAGGASGGEGIIVALYDDDRDGRAERYPIVTDVHLVHGLALADGGVYFTEEHDLLWVPWVLGERSRRRPPPVVRATLPTADRWTHGLAVGGGGALYATSGLWAPLCSNDARTGGAFRFRAGAMAPLATGLTNPMYVHCHATGAPCLASELPHDLIREGCPRDRIVALREGADFGAPCCMTTGVPDDDSTDPSRCASVTPEVASLPPHSTPFGLDWAPSSWPSPFADQLFVALHGSFYTPGWPNAGVVFTPTDPATHLPTGPWTLLMRRIATSSDGIGRPADVAFAPDGRLFVADDMNGAVYFIAPESLRAP